MRRNRKVTNRMSVIAGTTMHAAAVVVILFVMVILNVLASSSCSQLMKSIGEKERLLEKLGGELSQETSRWQAMTTPDRLEAMLLRRGMAMRLPRSDQWVRLMPNGQPHPGQLSVKRLKERTDVGMAQPVRSRRR